MRGISFFLNTSVVVFGVAAAILSLSSPILAVICGVIAALATGASLVWGAWQTFLDTPYLTIPLENVRPGNPILLTPRRGMPDGTKANFWKWLFKWIESKPYVTFPPADTVTSEKELEKPMLEASPRWHGNQEE